MGEFQLSTFVPQELHFPYTPPPQPGDRLSEAYDIPWDARKIPNNPAIQLDPDQEIYPAGRSSIWLVFVPGNSVARLQKSDSVFSTFTDIIDESSRNLQNDTYNDPVSYLRQPQESKDKDQEDSIDAIHHDPEECIKWTMARKIASIFSGMVDPDDVFADEIAHSDGYMTPRDGRREVVIEKPSNNPDGRLARDIVIFEVDNCKDFFENAWTQSLILRRLIHSGMEPTSVERTVEYPQDVPPYEGEIGISIGV